MLLLVSADTFWAARQHYLKNHCSHGVMHTREARVGQNTDSSNQCLGPGYTKNPKTHQYMKFSQKIYILFAL